MKELSREELLEDCEFIKNYDLLLGVRDLVAFVLDRWDGSYELVAEPKFPTLGVDYGVCYRLSLSTIGLRENELLIEALQANKDFFFYYHEQWQRGGHYVFTFRYPEDNLDDYLTKPLED
jgi:hypothetical protein